VEPEKEKIKMESFFAGLWSTLIVRGSLSIIFGICAFVWPGNFMAVLSMIFGVYLLVDGTVSVWSAFATKQQGRAFSILGGLLSIAIGLTAIITPAAFIGYLILLIGLWNIYLGVLQILTAIAMRKEFDDSGMQAFWGGISILFGLAISYYWWAGVVTIAWLIGLASITTGAILIWLGMRLRKVAKHLPDANA
jgi:uncharacterized membrane protein HdeD (DUF308 family)